MSGSERGEVAGRPVSVWQVAPAAGALGLALASAPVGPLALALCAGAAVALFGSAPRVALAALIALATGLTAGEARLAAIDRGADELRPGQPVAGLAHLIEPPRPGRYGPSAVVEMASGRLAGARFLARLPRRARLPPRVGGEIALAGTVRAPPPTEPDGFDLRGHLRRRGIGAAIEVARARPTGRRRDGLHGWLDEARSRAERGAGGGLSRERAALVRGMVLGQDESIDPFTRQEFRDSGLAHLLAVSGQNVALLVALVLPLLAFSGLPPPARLAAALACVAAYVPLAGAGPSLQRAGVMGAASLVALAASRPSSRVYALSLAACVTLAANPRAVGDPGWQLSFAAVAGILALAPGIRRGLGALPRPLAEGIAVTVAATVATAPLLSHHFGSVPLAGLAANVAALPLVAPIMWLGMVRAAIGELAYGPLAGLAEGVNALLAPPLGWLADALTWVARTFASIPGGQVALPLPSRAGLVVAYVLLVVGALVLPRLARRVDLEPAAARWRRLVPARRRTIVCGLGVVAALGFARLTGPGRAPDVLTVSFLDVGQGDATLVQHPDGSAVLFDGGPPEGGIARLLRRAGITRLSALVMTHASRDHHGGLGRVAESVPIDLLIDGGDGTKDPDFRRAVRTAVRRGARRVRAMAPMTARAGSITIEVLAPGSRPPGPAPEDPNPRAVVAIVASGGFRLLLSGDAESPSILPLAIPDVDALKLPHHGSSDPGLPDLLARARPEMAAIEVGENDYGHPAPSTLAVLRGAGVPTWRTDRHGTVRLEVDRGEMAVRVEGGP